MSWCKRTDARKPAAQGTVSSRVGYLAEMLQTVADWQDGTRVAGPACARLAMDFGVLDTAINAVGAGFRHLGWLSSAVFTSASLFISLELRACGQGLL